MAALSKCYCFVADVANGVHNLGTGTLRILLTNDAPTTATTAVKTDVTPCTLVGTAGTEVVAFTGYATKGPAVGITSSTQTTGTYKLLQSADVTITNTSGGATAAFRYVLLYNDSAGTAAARPVIGWWDYTSSITLANNESFTLDLDTGGILQIT